MEHGKRWTYTKHGCRCDECRTANTTYQRELRQRKRDGERTSARMDAGQAQAHITELRAAGWSYRAIGAEAKLTDITIRKIHNGQVRAEALNIQAILSVK
jgi:hypothetical protein